MDESFNTKLGFEIKQARLAANLSQEQLAELLNVDRTYISFLESGKRSPSLETFIQLLNHLDIKLSFLPYEWLQKLYSVCSQYNLEIKTLADTINDPKVIPMLRGKAFEFTACNIIRNNLPKNKYQVSNPKLNAQSSIKDIDVELRDLINDKKYTIECKLAAKGSFREKVKENKNFISIRVKCMRSRTLGEVAATRKAEEIGISKEILMIHNDQYLADDFDFVITSIANAFYETEEETRLYYWSPSQEAKKFLKLLGVENQEEAFYKIYIARSKDLAVDQNNNVKCSRKKCKNQNNCGFIPNYPYIYFDKTTGKVIEPWIEVEKFQQLLND